MCDCTSRVVREIMPSRHVTTLLLLCSTACVSLLLLPLSFSRQLSSCCCCCCSPPAKSYMCKEEKSSSAGFARKCRRQISVRLLYMYIHIFTSTCTRVSVQRCVVCLHKYICPCPEYREYYADSACRMREASRLCMW